MTTREEIAARAAVIRAAIDAQIPSKDVALAMRLDPGLISRNARAAGITVAKPGLVRDGQWVQSLAEVLTWQRSHGQWPRQQSSLEGERRLGWWINTQRTMLREGRLAQSRSVILHAVGILPGRDETPPATVR